MLSKVMSRWSMALSNNWKIFALSGVLLTTSLSPVYGQTTSTPNEKDPTQITCPDNLPNLTSAEANANLANLAKEAQKSYQQYLLTKLEEAQKVLAKDCVLDDFTVGISLLERHNGKIHFVKMLKTDFITRGYQQDFTLEEDKQVKVTIDQPNFINTKVSVEASNGLFTPLMVKYPIIRGGKFKEMGYYTPAHRSIQSDEFAKLGDEYITKVLLKANKELKCNNLDVSDRVFNMAKLLCIVEHVDHGRYRAEDKQALFNEVRTLYALNRANTYRYAVSSAGAGGMVQMIASTYKEIKGSFPEVSWISDFEQAMMTHENASKAMLLYLNRYYNFFSNNDSVTTAWENGFATQEEVMAAGYNSNPNKVPRNFSQGEHWKRGLPQETQIYLAILRSLDESVTVAPPENYQVPDRVTRVVYKPNRHKRDQIRNVRFKTRYKASPRYSTNYKRSLRSSKATSNSRYSYKQSNKAKVQVKAKRYRGR